MKRFLFAALSICLMLCVSCAPADTQSVSHKIEVSDYVHEHNGEFCIRFERFKYNGHWYLINENTFFHSPDCDCQDENNMNKPSSLLIDW